MTKLRLIHKGKQVGVEVDPDAEKVRNHAPLRFRISHGIEVNTGVETFFMNRAQVEELQLEVLTEILADNQPGSQEILKSAESRAGLGQTSLVRTALSVGKLTHPDVMMLIDMRQNPNQYVNQASRFAKLFNNLSRKVMDLAFYGTLNGPNPRQQVQDFIRTTGLVTRGMDQFVYSRPNASAANPYVNFSVINSGQNCEDLRFPTHKQEKIPKANFKQIFAYYVNELFNCYRRYLRMLGAAEVLPGNTDEVSAAVFIDDPGKGPGEGGAAAETVIEGNAANEARAKDIDAHLEEEAERAAQAAEEQAYDKKAAKREKKARKEQRRKETVLEAFREFKRESAARSPSKLGLRETPPRPSKVGLEEPPPEIPPQGFSKVGEQVFSPPQGFSPATSSSSSLPRSNTPAFKDLTADEQLEQVARELEEGMAAGKYQKESQVNAAIQGKTNKKRTKFTRDQLVSVLKQRGFPYLK